MILIAFCISCNKVKQNDNFFLMDYDDYQIGSNDQLPYNVKFEIEKGIVFNDQTCTKFKLDWRFIYKTEGLLFYKDKKVYSILSNSKEPQEVFEFLKKEGDEKKIKINGKEKVIKFEKIYSLDYYKKATVYKYRIKGIIPPDYERYPEPSDLVFFINETKGIIGLYYSMILPKEFGEKEVVFHIQGDILLFNENYDNVILGINTFNSDRNKYKTR